LLAFSLIYEKEESCRQQFLERIFYTPEEMEAVLEILSDDPEYHDWVKSVIPLMQCREDDQNAIFALIDELKKETEQIHDMNKKLFATHVRHFKERHAEATSQIPKLVEKVKQVDGAGNKVKEVFKYIPASIKESIEKEKERNRELSEIRRSRRKAKVMEPSDEIVILGLRIKISNKSNASSISSISLQSAPQNLDDFSKNRTKIRRIRKKA